MTIVQAIIIAIIEGITEFLPVSSTAHMKFANPLLGIINSPFTDMFEVVIQLAAILAVVVLYWKKFFDFKRIGFYVKLIIAVVPALVFGILLKKHIDAALGNLSFIAWVMVAVATPVPVYLADIALTQARSLQSHLHNGPGSSPRNAA